MLVILPPTSGVVYFCATNGTGVLRWVSDPAQCTSREFPVFVTPNDDPPAVTTTLPANGASTVAVNTNITVNFSESVTANSSSFTLECPTGTAKGFVVTGSPGSSIILDPTADLPQGTTCAVKVVANQISDSDTLDPPDHMAADYNFSFVTDSAPAVTSTSPANGATGVAADGNITVSFSETVNAGGGSFTLECPTGSAQAFSVSGSGTSVITIDPSADLPAATTCTVTVLAAGISDVDGGDPPDNLAANYVFSFTTADAAPTVTSTSPADAADHVAVNTNIVVNFSEPVTANGSSFTLECPVGTPQSFAVSGSPGSSITLDPTSNLPEGTICSVTVIAANISDVDSVDPPDNMAANYPFSFTTDSAPAITTTTPADNATDVDPSANITVNFNEPVDVTTSSFTISCDTAAQTFAVSGSGTSSITLDPDSDLPGTETCTVTAVAANISDTDSGDPPDHPAANFAFSFTTQDAAPSVTSTSPADGATDVARNASINVTFSEPVTASGGSFTLECPTGNAQAFTVLGSPGSTITLDPNADLPLGETCTVTVFAAGISDVDAVDPPDNMAANYQFSFTVVANQAPTDINLSNSSVDENQPSGTTVGTLSTTDPDAGDTFTYSLVSGTGDTDNGSFTITGDTLKTNAVFDFETKSSYSIRVQSTDSGSLTFEKVFTISVNNVNEAPSDIALSNASVDENQASGTNVGTLSATDQDAGDTHTFSLVSGTGDTDNASFQITGTTLKTNAVFNFEVKSSYSVRVRATDSGSATFEKVFTISINDVNDAPVAVADSYGNAVGNTQAVLGTTGSGPHIVLTGNVITNNDTDEDATFPHTISAVAETVASTGGGSATIAADGSFTFLPGVGDKNQVDTFTYHITDGALQSAGTVSVTIANVLVWYVNGAAGAGDGRSSSPLNTLSGINGAGGAGDSDGTGDVVFMYSGTYGGGLPLEASQKLTGEPHGLTVNPGSGDVTLVAAGGTNPTIGNSGGAGIALANGVEIQRVNVNGTSGAGVTGSSVTTAIIGTNTSIGGATGNAFELAGAASGNINVGSTISSSTARSVSVQNRSGGFVNLTGNVTDTGQGIFLNSNTGATITLTGALTISTGANPGFTATGGGTVNANTASNTIATTTGTALNVQNTTIGASGLVFRSVAVNGAVNGIVLNSTGASGSLSVTGLGSVVQGGDNSGGTIQNTSGDGISLTNTLSPSFNNMNLQSTAGHGVNGTLVANFSFTNGKINNAGTLSDHSCASFDNLNAANATGTFTFTNNQCTQVEANGVDIENWGSTLSNATISNNQFTDTGDVATPGSAVVLNANATASANGVLTKATLANNSISDFRAGAGFVLQANSDIGGSHTVTYGTPGDATNVVAVTGNLMNGGLGGVGNQPDRFVTGAVNGRGSGNYNVSNNGTVANPIQKIDGVVIELSEFGDATVTATVNDNHIAANNAVASSGLGIGCDADSDATTTDNGSLTTTISGNTISLTDGPGIFTIARGSECTLVARIINNTVAAPNTTTAARAGIRVDSGSAVGDNTLCVEINGNTTAGSTNVATATTSPGINLRKQGTSTTVNIFGIEGLSPSPAGTPTVENWVNSQNTSTPGTFGVGGTALLSATTGFTSCTAP
jgi:methionine-rich copper-binding protein CopC